MMVVCRVDPHDAFREVDWRTLFFFIGLFVLVAVFSALRPERFPSAFNIANLLNQSAAVVVLAMGLVFVLLLGEIDLSAGFTGGTAAGAGSANGVTLSNFNTPTGGFLRSSTGSISVSGTAGTFR